MNTTVHTKQAGNPWFTVSIGLLTFIIGFGVATALNTNTPGTRAVANQPSVPSAPTPTAPQPAAPTGTPATADDDYVLGDKNATVTIVEFSDYQCPFCRKFWNDALPQLKTEYINTGKVKLVFRDYPLNFHPAAQISAEAVECAFDQSNELAWEMHDLIFQKQADSGSAGTVQYTKEDLVTWAASLTSLNQQTWKTCLDSGSHAAEIAKDMADGQKAGVTGTPGFWILGPGGKTQQLKGAQPFSAFKAAIDGML